MPTLNQYTKSNDKEGYYIRANIGTGSPITLQVSDLAERILELLDYDPPATVPTKLVWNMYDVGLLYTLNSLSSAMDSEETDSSDFLAKLDLDSTLSPERENEIIRELKEYDGPDTEEVDELIERLEESSTTSPDSSPDGNENISLLQRWAQNPDKISDLIKSFDGYEEFAASSIETFARHPHSEVPPIWLQDTGAIKYKLKKKNKSRDIFIYDIRFHPQYDFKVIIDRGDDRREIADVSRNGHIIDYRNEAGRIGSRIRISGMLDWIVPDEKILAEIPSSSDMYVSGGITEYEGEELEVILEPDSVDSSNLVVGVVDRISTSDNPVVGNSDDHFIIDQGKPGEKYLIEMMSQNRGRVLSRFKNTDEE